MKIAYVFSHDIYSNDGIVKKIKSQYDHWEKSGLDVELFCMQDIEYKNNCNTILPSKTKIFLKKEHPLKRLAIPSEILQELLKFNPDIVYLRYEPYKVGFMKIMKNFKTIIEINSYDVSELRLYKNTSLKDKLKYIYNKFTRDILFNNVSAFIFKTYEMSKSKEFTKYKKPYAISANSIDLNNFKVIKHNEKAKRIPKLVFIGTADQEWHGIDKIEALAKATENELEFHIIGISQKDKNKPNNIKYYGFLQKEEYIKIISNCDIGIGTLALHRKNMNEANSLKVREYLAYGLPTIIAYKDTHFLNTKLPKWLLTLENNETNIINNIQKILTFSYVYKDYIVKPSEIYFLNTENTELKVVEFFRKVCGENIN